jgi:hypothetical protein
LEIAKDKEKTKVALLDDWKQNDWGSKEFRNLLTCCAVDELQAKLGSVGETRSVHQIVRDVVDSGDFDGAEPPLNARKLVSIMQKIDENPHYTPMCQGGRPTILNSSTATSFWRFIESELKKRNPSGQSSVIDQENQRVLAEVLFQKLWMAFKRQKSSLKQWHAAVRCSNSWVTDMRTGGSSNLKKWDQLLPALSR